MFSVVPSAVAKQPSLASLTHWCIQRHSIFQIVNNVVIHVFSIQWASKLCETSDQARSEECARREEFELQFGTIPTFNALCYCNNT